jgi:hypothetical protein
MLNLDYFYFMTTYFDFQYCYVLTMLEKARNDQVYDINTIQKIVSLFQYVKHLDDKKQTVKKEFQMFQYLQYVKERLRILEIQHSELLLMLSKLS